MPPPRGPTALLPAVPAAVVAWVVAAAALSPRDALAGVHSYTGTGYDDGVYLGASVRLLHGQLPYLDYDLLHPPAVVWMGLPFAALGELTSGSVALAAVRVLTVLAAGVNVLLAGAVVRSGGRLAVFTTASLFALMPASYAATQTLLLEPYVVLFALAGLAVLGTAGGGLAPRRRVLLAGALVGLAVAFKLFGVLVAVAVLLGLLPRWRDLRDWCLGLLAGFALPTLPLALLAPATFVRDVVLVQLGREDGDRGAGLRDRLAVVLGLDIAPVPTDRAAWMLAAAVAVALGGLGVRLWRRRLTRMHAIAAVAGAAVFAGMAQQRQFFDHYAYVVVAFVALPVGWGAAVLVDTLAGAARLRRLPLVVVAAVVAGGALLVPGAVDRSRAYTGESADPAALVRRYVPSGSCVVSDLTTVLLVSDRLDAPRSCDVPLDPFGAWFVGNDLAPPTSPPPYRDEFVGQWATWLRQADYVVLSVPRSNYVPWTPELLGWFDRSYVLVGSGPRTYVYYRLPG
ncbi:hypothetical protein GCM10027062_20440 [Nocardioides hungaricus]